MNVVIVAVSVVHDVIHATEELVAMLEEPAHDAQHALDVTQTHEAAFVL